MEYVMQVEIEKSAERGTTKSDWLYSRHGFSFGKYFDSNRINFGTLRVFNDDIVEPGKGFGTHSHDNMEIVTIVLEGSLKHKDSTGSQGIIKAGEIQRMSAGSGIQHSEHNVSDTERVHFLQIWVYPEKRDQTPSYEQKSFDPEQFKNQLVPIVSKTPSEAALAIHQDATFLLGHFDPGQTLTHKPKSKRHGVYVFVIKGEAQLGDQSLKKGDSATVSQADLVEIKTEEGAKLLLIEVSINTL